MSDGRCGLWPALFGIVSTVVVVQKFAVPCYRGMQLKIASRRVMVGSRWQGGQKLRCQ